MTTALFQDLFDYNFATNQNFIDILTKEDKASTQACSFLSHILNAHQIWINRVQAEGEPYGVWQEHPSKNWSSINQDLFDRTSKYLKSSQPELSLNRKVKYQNTKGMAFENTLQDIYFHIINHSTHHRAQIALLLRQNGIAPPVSDYIFYKR